MIQNNRSWHGVPKRCFMISPFKPNFNNMYKNYIKPSFERMEIEIIRADENPSSGLIFDKIQKMVNEADIILADITGNNPNVMLEIGLALASGKIVYYIVDDKNKATIPTDIQAYEWWSYVSTQSNGKPDWFFPGLENQSLADKISHHLQINKFRKYLK